MITITPVAQEKLSSYLTENKLTPQVRVYLSEGGCSGGENQISLTLDQPNANDITINAGDLELFISKKLFAQVGQVVIDFRDNGQDSGFVVESEKQVPTSASDCGSCCGCG